MANHYRAQPAVPLLWLPLLLATVEASPSLVHTHEGRIPHVAVVGAGPNALRLIACMQPHSALVSVEAFEAEAVGNTISSW